MDKFENIKEIVLKRAKSLINYIRENWQLSTVVGLSLVLLILIFTVVVPNTRRNIRVKQVESLVMADVADIKQIKTVDFDQLEAVISKKEQILVAIVDPNDANYEQFTAILNDKIKMTEFKGTLYFYPILYDFEKVKKFYHLTTGVTLIYFKNQAEVDRISLDNQQEIELYLVDHLNSLIRPSGKELERIEAERKRAEAEEAARQAENEETIDELQESNTGTIDSSSVIE